MKTLHDLSKEIKNSIEEVLLTVMEKYKSPQVILEECPRGDWLLLWYNRYTGLDRKTDKKKWPLELRDHYRRIIKTRLEIARMAQYLMTDPDVLNTLNAYDLFYEETIGYLELDRKILFNDLFHHHPTALKLPQYNEGDNLKSFAPPFAHKAGWRIRNIFDYGLPLYVNYAIIADSYSLTELTESIELDMLTKIYLEAANICRKYFKL